MKSKIETPAATPADQINPTTSEFRTRAEATYALIMEEIEGDPLKRRQFDIEVGMAEAGARRFWEQQNRVRPHTDARTGGVTKGHESQSAAGKKLVRNAISAVAGGIAEFMAKADAGKPGKRHVAVSALRGLTPEEIAVIALRVTIDAAALALHHSLTNVSIMVGAALDEEQRIRAAEAIAPDLMAKIERGFKTGNTTHRRRVYAACIHRAGLAEQMRQKSTDRDRLLVGRLLVDLIIQHTGLLALAQSDNGKQRGTNKAAAYTLVLSDGALEWIGRHDERAQYADPVWAPSVIPPRPWRSFRSGGYHYSMAGRVGLIRDYEWKKPHQRVKPDEIKPVLAAINAVQETRWKINTDVLDAMQEAFAEGSEIGGLPARDPHELPTAPSGIPEDPEARTEAQIEQLSAWKRRAREIHSDNNKLASRKGALARAVYMATSYRDEAAIYFPHFLDFRGRVYPTCQALSPQGHDWQKALLTFADALPLGDQGAEWLAVHGANCMGTCPETGVKLDKATFQSRIDWVLANADRIKAVALHRETDWWSKADAPWMFFAFCKEWQGVLEEWEFNGTPAGYKSRLPVSFDGSANGLQHFSAMLRDEVGGAATNLVPQETPADIYAEVQRACLARVLPDAKAGKPEAVYWIDSGNLDRSMMKRPVMTMPYGSKRYGITDQLLEELRKRGVKTNGKEMFAACSYLSQIVWEELGTVAVKAREMMEWLQAIAKAYAAQNMAMTWRLPSGFVVSHDYRKSTMQRVDTRLFGKNVCAGEIKQTEATINGRASENAISPNFVHSYDACAQVFFVIEARALGISSFASVHDSFGTHAARAWDLFTTIRSSFISLYETNDPCASLLAQVREDLGDEVHAALEATVPCAGQLDLMGVLASDFFFA